MRSSPSLSPRAATLMGFFAVLVGGLVALHAFGLLTGTPPRDAPPWVIVLGGLVLVLGGAALIVGYALAGGAAPDGDLPPGTPRWIRILQLGLGLGMVGSLGTIFGWIAFGPGPRAFTVTGSFGRGTASEVEGRTLFGAGTVLIALFFVALLVVGLRRLRGRR